MIYSTYKGGKDMSEQFFDLKEIFLRTKEAIHNFMDILTPRIENAKDDHERLYYHHIYEEEEQRLDRLSALIPKIEFFLESDIPNTPASYPPSIKSFSKTKKPALRPAYKKIKNRVLAISRYTSITTPQ
jgi:hypothetical protein